MSPTLKAHIALFLVALIYAANYTIAKEVMNNGYIQPLGFILMRVVTAMVLFWIIHALFVRESIQPKDWGRLVLCGLFGVAINQMLFFSGLELTKPINASLIATTIPITVLIASALIIGEAITKRKLLGIFIGALGAVLLIAWGQNFFYHKDQMFGDVMIIFNAMSYGLYLVLVKDLMMRYNPITVVKWVFTFGFFMVLPFGIGQFGVIDWASFTPSIWLAVAYVLICTTFFTYLFNAYALKIVNPSVVSTYVYLQPLLASIIAIWAGSDSLNGLKVVAGGFIFVGVYLVGSRSKPKSSSKTVTD